MTRNETVVAAADDGFELAVQVSGREGAPALLLLAGQANSHAWWNDVRPAFDDRFRVVTFDYRGTGGSRGTVGPWSTRSFAADATSVLSALAIGSASVYGASMGGRVAQMVAIDHPHLVERLVLACTSPGGPVAREHDPEVRRALAHPDRDARLRQLHRLFYTDNVRYECSDGHLFGDPTMTAAERQAHRRASDTHDAWADLPRIAAPTLVLHGSDDQLTPAANAPLLAERIPTSQLHLHDGGRHGFFEEFAGTVTRRVLAFLRPYPNTARHEPTSQEGAAS